MLKESSALDLRAIEESDLDQIKRWQSQSALRDMVVGYPFPISDSQVMRWWTELDGSQTPNQVVFGIHYDHRLVGVVALKEIDWIHRCASISIYLGEEDIRGRGVGRRSTCCLVDYAFRNIGLRRLTASVIATNSESIKMFASLGFVIEGEVRERYFVDGSWHTALLFGLLVTDDFPKRSPDKNVLKAP